MILRRLSIVFVLLFSSIASAKVCGKLKRLEYASAVTDFTDADGTVFKKQTVNRAKLGDWAWDVLGSKVMIRNWIEGATCPSQLDMESASEDGWGLAPVSRVLVRLTTSDEQRVLYYDLPTCAKLWEKKAREISVEDRRVKMKSDCGACERTKRFDRLCTCQGAEVWTLNKDCDFELSKAESKALTKKELGVGFLGKEDVVGGRTRKAKIAK